MIVIKRGKEPNSLLKFCKENPDADYESDMPTDVLKDMNWNERMRVSCRKGIYLRIAELSFPGLRAN